MAAVNLASSVTYSTTLMQTSQTAGTSSNSTNKASPDSLVPQSGSAAIVSHSFKPDVTILTEEQKVMLNWPLSPYKPDVSSPMLPTIPLYSFDTSSKLTGPDLKDAKYKDLYVTQALKKIDMSQTDTSIGWICLGITALTIGGIALSTNEKANGTAQTVGGLMALPGVIMVIEYGFAVPLLALKLVPDLIHNAQVPKRKDQANILISVNNQKVSTFNGQVAEMQRIEAAKSAAKAADYEAKKPSYKKLNDLLTNLNAFEEIYITNNILKKRDLLIADIKTAIASAPDTDMTKLKGDVKRLGNKTDLLELEYKSAKTTYINEENRKEAARKLAEALTKQEEARVQRIAAQKEKDIIALQKQFDKCSCESLGPLYDTLTECVNKKSFRAFDAQHMRYEVKLEGLKERYQRRIALINKAEEFLRAKKAKVGSYLFNSLKEDLARLRETAKCSDIKKEVGNIYSSILGSIVWDAFDKFLDGFIRSHSSPSLNIDVSAWDLISLFGMNEKGEAPVLFVCTPNGDESKQYYLDITIKYDEGSETFYQVGKPGFTHIPTWYKIFTKVYWLSFFANLIAP